MNDTRTTSPLDEKVRHFRDQVAHLVETCATGPELLDSTERLFRVHAEGHQAHTDGMRRDLTEISACANRQGAMLAHVGRSVAREVETAGGLAALVMQHSTAQQRAREIIERLQEEQPEVATELLDALAVPAAPEQPIRPVTIAFYPDQRFRFGWFYVLGSDTCRSLPFAGWSLVAESPTAISQTPEAAFMAGGRVRTLTELETLGMTLQSCE